MFGGIELSDDELARHILSASGPFETLLLPGAASLPEAKAAYKQIAKRLHPDKSAHREAAEAFKAAGNALLQLENSHATKDRWQGWCYEQPTPGWSGPKQVDENTWQVAKAVWGKPKDVLGPKSKCTKRQKPTKARRASAASTVAKPSAKAGSNMTELQHFTALTMETRQPQSNQMASSPFASPRQRWGSIQKDTAQRPCMAASEVRSESSSEDLSSPSGSGLGCQQPSTGEEPRRWGTQPSTEGACSEEVEDVTLQQRWGSLAGGKQGAHQHRVAQEACADVLSGSSTASSADDRPPQAFHAYQQNGIYRGNFRKVGKRLYKCS